MATAEGLRPGRRKPTSFAAGASRERERLWAWSALAVILAGSLGLRLWGIAQGLPLLYNTDEGTLFMPQALAMFANGLNPHYFENPSAFTYALHLLVAARYGGGRGVELAHQQAAHLLPAATIHSLYVMGRLFTAVLGTITVWLLYLTGARLFGRAAGLLAALVLAVAFLPVFYSHLVLNDVPTLAPLTLSLLGSAGVMRRGRTVDYLLAGLGLGLAAGTKYTGGIAIVTLLGAALPRLLAAHERRDALRGLLMAGALALLAFLATNPYAILDFHAFREGIAEQSERSSEAQGKLGAPHNGGLRYYLWSFTWGLGWVPSLAALAGVATVWIRDRQAALALIPTVIAFLIFMGLQTRYFGRWVLPIFPIACLFAAHATVTTIATVRRLAAGRARLRAVAILAAVLAVAALAWQGIVYSIHSDRVLSRPYTGALALRWMIAHVPSRSPGGERTKILLEPIVPNAWVEYPVGSPQRANGLRDRWEKVLDQRYLVQADGRPTPNHGIGRAVDVEDYERTLTPALIPYYEREGICIIVSGSTQRGRAEADPTAVPQATAYYRALQAAGEVVHRVSPYRPGSAPVAFNYDWSFDYYPLSYVRPGPEITIYRLSKGRCAGSTRIS